MLSYQHLYHAGNLVDVHKHGVLAWVLDYLTLKDKPLSYIETHAGRGVYDLGADEAIKTARLPRGSSWPRACFLPTTPTANGWRRRARLTGQRPIPVRP